MANSLSQIGTLGTDRRKALLEKLKAKKAASRPRGESAVPRRDVPDWPLSFAQERLWFLDRLEPGSPLYNMPAAFRIEGRLDARRLAKTFSEILRRHEALRARFFDHGGRPSQVVAAAEPVRLASIDLSRLGEAARTVELRRRIDEEARRPFDLGRGPLLRSFVFKLGDDESVLAVTLHHIAGDGWSVGVLAREFVAIYEGRSLPELPIQYADYAHWQRRWLEGEVLEKQLAYWKGQLAGAPPVLGLPTDRSRPAVASHRGARLSVDLGQEVTERLRELARVYDATLFMALLAAFQALLFRWSGERDLVVGSPIANRNRRGVEGLIGFFVNTLALRGRPDGRLGFTELLESTRKTALEAYSHQDVPFEKLVAEVSPQRSRNHTPLFQVLFVLQEAPLPELTVAGARLVPLALESGTAKFDLTLTLAETPRGLTGSFEYDRDLFDATTVRRMAGHFEALAADAAAGPEKRLAKLAMLTPAERHQVTEEWNATPSVDPEEEGLHRWVEARATEVPEAVALVFEDRHVSYGTANARANQLARYLGRSAPSEDEVRIGICVERSPEMAVGLLAILKAGAAFVPLDPSYPRERLAFVLEQAAPRAVVVQDHLAELVPETPERKLVRLGADGPEIARESPVDPEDGPGGDKLAYVIFTSGSTGQPKGAMNTHRGIRNRILWGQELFGFGACDRVLRKTPFGFDVSVPELFGTLAAGACLVMARPEGHKDNAYLAETLARERVTSVHFVPSMLQAFLEEPGLEKSQLGDCRSLVRLFTSGEALSGELEKRFFERLGGELWNLYGPTEAAVEVTFERGAVNRDRGGVPIGRPIANLRIHLFDRDFNPVPVHVAGELLIGGVGLARGYLARPDLTAEKFVPDPVYRRGPSGERLYRSGDLARRLADGRVEFLGRLDHQVKIRGWRIELGEIEAVLSRHPAVGEAVVMAQGAAEPRLVAWVVADGPLDRGGKHSLDQREVRAWLRERLPEAMVPAVFVPMEALPLTANGKVDRRALPAPEGLRPDLARYVAPETPAQKTLAEIWAEVLRVERVGLHDDFFDLGGHSLLATRLLARIREAFGVEMPVGDVFDAPTVAGLAERISAGREAGTAGPLPSAARELPLSFSQQRLWFLDRLEPGSALYNMAAAFRLRGRLRAGVLGRVLDELVRRHEVLRTRFVASTEEDGEAVQVVDPASPVPLPVADLGALADGPRAVERERLIRAEARQPFDLERGPVLRFALLRTGELESTLLVTLHHIVADGWSVSVLMRELAALYEAFAAGRPSPLPELELQYGAYAVWQRYRFAGEALGKELDYWRRQLAGMPPVLALPTDRPRPVRPRRRGGRVHRDLAGELSAPLALLARRQGATLFMSTLAVFEALLSRYSGEEDVAVGTPIANRNHPGTQSLIGFFVNTLVMRGDLSGRPSFRELLDRGRAAALEAYAHQDLPFDRLVAELAPERGLGSAPLFQVMFVHQNAPLAALELPDLVLEPFLPDTGTAKFDLTLTLTETEAGLSASFEYDRDLFDATTVRRMAGHLEALFAGVVADPERRVAELPLLGDLGAAQLLREWNDTQSDFPAESIHRLFKRRAEERPDAVAAVFEDLALSYRELDRRSDRLACRLRELGVQGEAPVGTCLGRSLEMLAATLAVLKADGVYVPLDPSYPKERLAFMFEDVGASVLLAERRWESVLPDSRTVIFLDEEPRQDSWERPPSAAGPDHLAYVMFTSGSTGRPKGVAVAHRGVVRLVRETDFADFGPREVFLQLAPISFDAATLEIWGPLLAGGRVAVFPDRRPTFEEIGEEIERRRVTSLWLTASLFHQVVDGHLARLRPLRQLLAGGDVLSPPHVRRALGELSGCTLVNGYGPTENTTFTCCHRMKRPAEADGVPPEGDRHGRSVSLGRPIRGTRIYLLDRYGRPVPAGVVGQLMAGGAGLARGYVRRPALTAEKLVPDGESGEPGARLYATGDLARRLADGRVEFLGRADYQVKVRGYRVELGEVETVLTEHPAVRRAVVVAREAPGGEPNDKRLAAYLVANGEPPGTAEFRRELAVRLPEAAVPSYFVWLESLPVNANGKVDRRALPAPQAPSEAVGYVAPRNPAEEVLAETYAELLGLERVGIRDSFFDLGGHSLLATRLVSRLRETLRIEVPLKTVFESPSAAELAEALPRTETAAERIPRRGETGEIPLSFSQERLWFLHRLEPENPSYNLIAGLRLTGRLAAAALEAALGRIVERHEVLRTTYALSAEGPIQVVEPAAAAYGLSRVDLAGLGPEVREAELRRLAARECRRSFNLTRGPLLRTALLILSEVEHVLLATLHHVAADGWSVHIFLRELGLFYRDFAEGVPSALPELPIQYADFAVWQRGWLTGEALERQLGYWREQLAGAPQRLDFPTDRPRPAVRTFRGTRRRWHVGAELTGTLRELGQRAGTTLYATLLAGFHTLLARYCGQRDLLVGSPIANRNRAETEGLIGCFINTLVLRGRLEGDPSFLALLARTREATVAAYAHQDLPFEKLVEEIEPERSRRQSPLFQVLFQLLNTPSARPDLPGLEVTEIEPVDQPVQFDQVVRLDEVGDALEGTWGYHPDLFDSATVARLCEHFTNLLEDAAENPEKRLSELELLAEAERRELVVARNATAARYALAPIHHAFEARCDQDGEAVAVVFEGSATSYRELDRAANRLAHHLLARGAGPEVRVGVLLERSLEMVVALYAILKTGGAYVPLDPFYPEDRLAFLLEDLGRPLVVTRTAELGRFPGLAVRAVDVDREAESIGRRSSERPDVEVGLDHAAYAIYTSGSTGRPKGVVNSHRGISNRLLWMQEAFGLAAGDRVLQKTPYSFDVSVWEFFWPLRTGACLVVARPEGHRDAAYLVRRIREEKVTTVHFVPSMLQLFVEEPELASLTSLRRVIASGEALPFDLVERFHVRSLACRREIPPVSPLFQRGDRTPRFASEGCHPRRSEESVPPFGKGGVGGDFSPSGEIRGPELHNLYGPTEAAVDVTWWPCPPPRSPPGGPCPRTSPERRVPIGKPIANTTVYVVDGHLRLVPSGVPGELLLGGVQLARGYLGRGGLTSERFVPDPFASVAGSRLYRTGDLTRLAPDGNVDYLGRIDFQVKLRGFRVELGEIEARLTDHPSVREAVVSVRGEGAAGQVLAAWVVAEGTAPSLDELRDFLTRSLPDYMLPGRLVVLDEMPLSPNGKVDRKKLPDPEPQSRGETAGFVAPRDAVERWVAGLWREALGLDEGTPVSAHDDFFRLGGNSIGGAILMNRIQQELGESVHVATIFEASTPASLARYLADRHPDGLSRLLGPEALPRPDLLVGQAPPADSHAGQAPCRAAQPALPENRQAEPALRRNTGADLLPLSFSQQRLWFLDRLESGSAFYSMPAAFRLTGPLRVEALGHAFDELVRRHEVLRTRFAESEGQPVQVIEEARPVPLPVVDLGALGDGRDAEAQHLALAEAGRPFDLARGPVLRFVLLRLGTEEHLLLATVHHIAFDGWSVGVLMRELAALYGGESLPELTIQYADYAVWQRAWLAGETLRAEVEFWRGQLAGAPPVLELAADRPRPPVQSFAGDRLPVNLPRTLTDGLADLGRRRGATLFMTLLAGFGTALYRHSRQDDMVVGSPVANRTRAELEGLIGFFVNTLAMRLDLSRGPSFEDLLGRLREVAAAAYAHQDLPFEKLVEELEPERSLSFSPIFQVLFVLQNAPREPLRVEGLEIEPLEFATGTSKFDLTLSLEETAEGLRGSLEYDTALFDRTSALRMGVHFEALLAAVVEGAGRSLAELPLLPPAEEHQVLLEWNDTAIEDPRRTVVEGFAERTSDVPDAVAVAADESRLSYRELGRRARHLACYLRHLGVRVDDTVALSVERSPAMTVGVLGILEAGAAYVPLDPAYPAKRLAYMIEASRARLLVTESKLHGRLPETGAPTVDLDALIELPSPSGREVGGEDPRPGNLAYVIYTSGSTGRPKGVALPHRALANLIRWQRHVSTPGPGRRTLQFASLSFDVSFQEMFSTWLSGGTLVLVDGETRRDAERLLELLVREEVERLFVPFVALDSLARAARGEPAPAALRDVITAGEQLRLTPALRSWLERCRLHNHYGPSETHATTAWTLPGPIADAPALPPIGRPLPGHEIHLLDPAWRPSPFGVPGELFLGGVGLAHGYFDRPGLTAERFVPHPFARRPGERLYRTGDLTRSLADGHLEFLGRLDHQVKVRGFRIEPGEIEALLTEHPRVSSAAVQVRRDSSGGSRLVAYVVPDGSSVAELREFVSGELPEYMVPSVWMELEALPLTPSGKVDRRSLPEPRTESESSAFRAPRTPNEEIVAGIFSELLGAGRLGADADFFALGGHSLLATQVLSRVRDRFRVELPVRTLFEKPTVAGLAGAIEEAARTAETCPKPPIVRVSREGPLPLSFAQQRLFFLAQLEPDNPVYNLPAVFRAHGRPEVPRLAAVFGEIARRHEVLRTSFSLAGEAAVQRIRPPEPFAVPVVDLRGLPAAAREAEAERHARADVARPFDLEEGPVLRLSVFRLAEAESVLVLNMHHISSDGWSMGILIREMVALWEGATLPELEIQYADFACWQREWLRGEALAAEVDWWRECLAEIPTVLELPADRPRPAVHDFRGGRRTRPVAAELVEALEGLSRREGTTLFMTLLAVYQTLLARYTERERLLVGSPIANRNRAETEGLIGFFVNTLVLPGDLTGDPPFRELLGRTRNDTLGAYAHQDLPFEKLVEVLDPQRDLGRSPLFQVMLVLQNTPWERLELPGLVLEPLPSDVETAKFDLTLTFFEGEGGLVASWGYKTALFDASTVARLERHFSELARSAAARPEARLTDLGVLSPAEATQLRLEWNDTEISPAGGDLCLHELFEAQAARTPEAAALLFGEAVFTYRWLEEAARDLSVRLREMGVGPETPVGLLGGSAPESFVGLFGVLMAGGAYVPLDPNAPAERVDFMVEDAGIRVLLTWGRGRGRTVVRPPGVRQGSPRAVELLGCVTPDSGGTRQAEDAHFRRSTARGEPRRTPGTADAIRRPATADAIRRPATADAIRRPTTADAIRRPTTADEIRRPATADEILAYVLYTSGSTGRPKGVAVAHRSVVRYSLGMIDRLRPPAGACFAMVQPLTVDSSVTSIFPPLFSGGKVHVVPRETAVDAQLLGEAFRRHPPDALKIAPSHFAALESSGAAPMPRRWLIVGGEASHWEWLRDLRTAHPDAAVFNHYGPTEATVGMLMYRVDPRKTPVFSEAAPIGRPLADATGHLLGRDLRPVPLGVPGTLYAGGDCVARGYLGRAGLTAERFVPDPWDGSPGARLYDTGDLLRSLADGNFVFLGRRDRQVKIRGQRIELGEVEGVLRRCPGVRQVLVVDWEGRTLVAYAVPRGGAHLGADELRSFVAERLPEAMVPSSFVVLEALPLTPHGKVDRQALPAPEARADRGVRKAPRNPVEERVAREWKRALNLEEVGIDESFFELGGHSLVAMPLVARLREAFAVDLPLKSLFEAPTVAALAAEIERLGSQPSAQSPAWPQIVPDPEHRYEPFPLTDLQQAYWLGRTGAFELGNVSAHHYREIEVEGLDVARLETAWQRLAERHECLRLRLLPDGRQQILERAEPYRIEVTDLVGRKAEAHLADVRERMTHHGPSLEGGPLFEIRATRLGDELYRLHMSTSLLLSDGWGSGILLRDLLAFYQSGAAVETRPAELSYRDYVLALGALEDSALYRRARSYWLDRLTELPPAPELPLARSPASLPMPRFTHRGGRLEPELWQQVKARATRSGVTATALMCTLYSEVLATWSKKRHFTLNCLFVSRYPLHPQVSEIVGNMSSTILLEVDMRPPRGGSGGETRPVESFETRVRRLQSQLWKDVDHGLFNGIRVGRELARLQGPAGRSAMPVVFTSTLDMGTGEEPETDPGGPSARPVHGALQTPQVWLDHQVFEDQGALRFNWDVVEELFPPGTVDGMWNLYRELLERFARDESAWQEERFVLVPREQLDLRAVVNATGEGPLPVGLLQDGFLEAVRQYPDEPAVVAEERTLTYRELDGLARDLGQRLRESGARPNRLAGVVLPKGWEQVVAVLGVLDAGAAYLPLDPALPQERLDSLLEHGKVELVVTRDDVSVTFSVGRALPVVSPEAPARNPIPPLKKGGHRGDFPEPTGEDLAYVIFTSGSTGFPKGVMIEHRSALNTVVDVNRRFGVGPGDRVLALSSLSFDLSVWDVFGLLAAGGAVVVPPSSDLREPARWLEWMVRERVTIWNTVPALMEMLVDHLEVHGEKLPETLRLVMMSGDWIPVTLPDRIRALAPGKAPQVVSLGGATEASIWSILHPVDEVEPSWTSIPYGRPMVHQTFHVLDERLEPRPVWVPGELHIGGAGLARGYWRDEVKTKASFYPGPGGERLYRTGDLGRYLPDGSIEFLGREDFQVKVQGYRIELGEIESVLLRRPDVRTAVVLALGEARGSKRLVGWVVPEEGAEVPTGELREYLRGKLPEYMVPAAFHHLDALPLTANGKVDRVALARQASHAEETAVFVPPRDEAEADLVRIFEEILPSHDLERPLGVKDDFFELGGHSLLAVRLMARVEQRFGTALPLSVLFDGATVEHLASVLGSEAGPARRRALVPIRPRGTKRPFFCVHPVGGNVLCYSDLVRHLDPERPFYGLQVPDDPRLETVEAMAEHYVEALREVQGEGPYLLGGWSMGGVVAYEMARRLAEQGEPVESLVLVDTEIPNGSCTLDDADLIAWFASDLAGLAGRDPVLVAEELRPLSEGERLSRFLASAKKAELLPSELGPAQAGALVEVFKTNAQALSRYRPKPWDGRLSCLWATEGETDTGDGARGWDALAAATSQSVPGNHYTLLQPPRVEILASRLGECLDN